MKHILIIGGGFAGINAAKRLGNYYKENNDYKVTLLSKTEFVYLYPFSIWIPTGKRKIEDITINIDKIAAKFNFNFVKEEVININTKEKSVFTQESEFKYHTLVLSTGVKEITVDGIENTKKLCSSLNDVNDIKSLLNKLMNEKKGDIVCCAGSNPNDTSMMRGAPACEVICNIDYLLRKKKCRNDFNLTICVNDEESLKRFLGLKGLNLLKKSLEERNIKFLKDNKITNFQKDKIVLDTIKIHSDLSIYIPALTGVLTKDTIDVPLHPSGFLKVDDYGRVENCTDVFAAGDGVYFDGPEWRAKQGKLSSAMGNIIAKNIININQGKNGLTKITKGLSTDFFLDMGNEGILIHRDFKREIAIKGRFVHLAKLALEKWVRFDIKN